MRSALYSRPRDTLIRRTRAAMVVFLIALATIVGATTAASAEKKCGGKPGEFVACLSVSHKGAGIYEIGIGVDVFLKPGESPDAILAQPGNAFSALLMGQDDDGADVLAAIPLQRVAGSSIQISAEFGRDVGTGVVNEDTGGQDELFARITLFNPANNTTRIMDTPLLRINI